jgi:O-antigen/teichoic acid export membrane protein
MSRGAIIVLLAIGISVQLLGIWVRRTGYRLTPRQYFALWTRTVLMLSALLSAGLSLIANRFQTLLDTFFVASMAGWLVSSVWFRNVLTTTPPKGVYESTWSPFQSDEVREICAHLVSTERAQLREDARERGRWIGRWFALPLALLIVALFWSWHLGLSLRLGLALVTLFAIYFSFSILPRFRAMRRRTIGLLCETEWARNRNYTPSSLRLMTFPWSK